jgi:hypothetical protein
MTQIFLHIYPVINTDTDNSATTSLRTHTVTPELNISIYRTEDSALCAQSYLGGIVLPSTADALKGRIDAEVYSTEVDEEFSKALDEEQNTYDLPMASLVCGYEDDPNADLPHIRDTKGWTFKKPELKWLEGFYKESGTEWNL